MNNKISIGVVVVLVAVGSFYSGMTYVSNQRIAVRNTGIRNPQLVGANLNDGQKPGTGIVRGGMGGLIAGEIISKDESGVTIKLNNSGSRIIFISEKTQITKSIPTTKEELVIGKQITISGTSNPEGSLSAESIQIK